MKLVEILRLHKENRLPPLEWFHDLPAAKARARDLRRKHPKANVSRSLLLHTPPYVVDQIGAGVRFKGVSIR